MLLFVITCYHYVFEITCCYRYDWVVDCNLLQVNLPIVLALRIVASETGLEDLPRDLEKHLAALWPAFGWSFLKGIRIPSPILFVRSPKPCSSFPRWIFKILACVDSGNLAGSCRNSLFFLLLYGQNARFP